MKKIISILLPAAILAVLVSCEKKPSGPTPLAQAEISMGIVEGLPGIVWTEVANADFYEYEVADARGTKVEAGETAETGIVAINYAGKYNVKVKAVSKSEEFTESVAEAQIEADNTLLGTVKGTFYYSAADETGEERDLEVYANSEFVVKAWKGTEGKDCAFTLSQVDGENGAKKWIFDLKDCTVQDGYAYLYGSETDYCAIYMATGWIGAGILEEEYGNYIWFYDYATSEDGIYLTFCW